MIFIDPSDPSGARFEDINVMMIHKLIILIR